MAEVVHPKPRPALLISRSRSPWLRGLGWLPLPALGAAAGFGLYYFAVRQTPLGLRGFSAVVAGFEWIMLLLAIGIGAFMGGPYKRDGLYRLIDGSRSQWDRGTVLLSAMTAFLFLSAIILLPHVLYGADAARLPELAGDTYGNIARGYRAISILAAIFGMVLSIVVARMAKGLLRL